MSKRPSSFFGRLDFSEKLFDRVLKQNLVAVIGRSGSGKSSVAQAGLLPLLRRQTPPADTWESILFTRGSKPFHRLAARLVPLCSPPGRDLTDIATESEKLATRLASDEVTLASFIDLALKNLPDTTRLIAIVDQFEELFTQTPQEGLRKRFVEELLAASRESNLTVVLTLRADFFGQAIKLRGLSDAIETGLVNVSEMTRAELKEAIEEPARLTGLQFEVGLVDRILDQVEQQPGSLPLLQYALTELWQRRPGRPAYARGLRRYRWRRRCDQQARRGAVRQAHTGPAEGRTAGTGAARARILAQRRRHRHPAGVPAPRTRP